MDVVEKHLGPSLDFPHLAMLAEIYTLRVHVRFSKVSTPRCPYVLRNPVTEPDQRRTRRSTYYYGRIMLNSGARTMMRRRNEENEEPTLFETPVRRVRPHQVGGNERERER